MTTDTGRRAGFLSAPGNGVLAVLILSAGLASCGGPRQPPRLATAPPPAAQAAPPASEAEPAVAASADAVPQVSPAVLASPPPAAEAVASPPPRPPAGEQPGELIGLTMRLLADRLGRPDFIQRDGPAEIWRYAGSDCFLDIFLYQKQGDLQVAHFEVRSGHPDKSRPDKSRPLSRTATDCYRDLRAQRSPIPG